MDIQTIVYDEDAAHAHSIIMDLSNTGAIIACADGDILAERDKYKLYIEHVIKADQSAVDSWYEAYKQALVDAL